MIMHMCIVSIVESEVGEEKMSMKWDFEKVLQSLLRKITDAVYNKELLRATYLHS